MSAPGNSVYANFARLLLDNRPEGETPEETVKIIAETFADTPADDRACRAIQQGLLDRCPEYRHLASVLDG